MVSVTGIGVFDATIQNSNLWFEEMMDDLDWKDKYRAYLALRVSLHTLRDMLNTRETAELGGNLPMLIRGLYYEGWTPTEKPLRRRSKSEFLGAIREYFNNDPEVHPERVAREVFKLVIKSMSENAIDNIERILPGELQDLWSEKVK